MILDTTALLLLLNKQTDAPKDKTTGEPVPYAHERVSSLVADLTGKGEKIVIATPVLAELLVRAETAASAYVAEFSTSSRFRIASFDHKAAIEHAYFTRTAIEGGSKFDGVPESWVKVKFDRQIVAIAVATGTRMICTDDEGLTKHAKLRGLEVLSLSEIRLERQMTLADAMKPETGARAGDTGESEGIKEVEGETVVETESPSPVEQVPTTHSSIVLPGKENL